MKPHGQVNLRGQGYQQPQGKGGDQQQPDSYCGNKEHSNLKY